MDKPYDTKLIIKTKKIARHHWAIES